VSEFRSSRSALQPRLERFDAGIADIRRMVELCRTTPGVHIPPTRMTPEEVQQLLRMMNFPSARSIDGDRFGRR